MRDLLDRYSKILNENDNLKLRRIISPELYSEIINHQKPAITESSLNRVNEHIKQHDCAMLSAFRKKLVNCYDGLESEDIINIKDNKGRNKTLKSALLSLGYGVTKVKGTYIENYMTDNAVEVNEDSFFVVNTPDDSNFIDNIVTLGKLFCQDSVLIMNRGGNDNYLVGTNNSEFPGFKNKIDLGRFKPGIEGEFMTKVGGRPFVTEHFKDLQNNSKRIVKDIAKPILKFLK